MATLSRNVNIFVLEKHDIRSSSWKVNDVENKEAAQKNCYMDRTNCQTTFMLMFIIFVDEGHGTIHKRENKEEHKVEKI